MTKYKDLNKYFIRRRFLDRYIKNMFSSEKCFCTLSKPDLLKMQDGFNNDLPTIVYCKQAQVIINDIPYIHLQNKLSSNNIHRIYIPKNVKKIYSLHCNNIGNKDFFRCIPYGIYNKDGINYDLIKEYIGQNFKKENLAYANFNFKTSPTRKQIFKNKSQYNFIKFDPIINTIHKIKRNVGFTEDMIRNYYEHIMKSKFVLCPEGHRIETFRVWETILLGSIPIVPNFPLYHNFKDDVPMLIVDDFLYLTQDFLEQEYDRISRIKYNKEKLTYKYWVDKIKTDLKVFNYAT